MVQLYISLWQTLQHSTICRKCLFCRHGKSPAQIMIKWSLQRGFICIPKSSKEARIKENFNLFDFEITKEDMQTLVRILNHNLVSPPKATSSFSGRKLGVACVHGDEATCNPHTPALVDT